MLAHELRNPLAPTRHVAEVMRLRPGDASALHWARDMIEQQVEHIAHLVDDLLDVSRITRGKIQLRMSPLNLSKVAASAVEAIRPEIESRGIHLEFDSEDDAVGVVADATRIEQIFANLLNNAAKFTDPGGHIHVSVAREGSSARVTIKDDGIGIAPDVLPKIFDLFAQADGTLDRSRGGLGIGLTLVRSLVELHGGTVTADSGGLGRGSCFIIRLPAVACPAAVDENRTDQSIFATRPLRVLVVDDNLHAAESLGMLLKLWGHESSLAHDGREALEIAAACDPEVILLDIGLPAVDGYEVARRLRASPQFRDVLLVAMTGYGQDEDRRRARDAGFDHHMVKPVDLDELRQLLTNPGSLRDIKT